MTSLAHDPADPTTAGSTSSGPTSSGPSFTDLGVPAPLVAALARQGIAAPFPIQLATLPDTLDPGAASVLQAWPAAVEQLVVVGDATTVTPRVLDQVVQELGDR